MFASLLNNTMTVNDFSYSADSIGGAGGRTSTALYTDEPCRMRYLKGDEKDVAGKDTADADVVIYSLPLVGVDEGCEIIIDGESFDVLLYEEVDKMDHHAEIKARRK